MLRHWTNTLVNRDFPRTLSWKVSNPLTSLVNSVPIESGSGVRVCKTTREGKTFRTMKSDFVVDLYLNAASNLEFSLLIYERFLDWRGTVKELDPLGLLSDSWEPIVPDTEKALSMGIDFHKKSNYSSSTKFPHPRLPTGERLLSSKETIG